MLRESLQAPANIEKTWRRHVMDINIAYGGRGLLVSDLKLSQDFYRHRSISTCTALRYNDSPFRLSPCIALEQYGSNLTTLIAETRAEEAAVHQ